MWGRAQGGGSGVAGHEAWADEAGEARYRGVLGWQICHAVAVLGCRSSLVGMCVHVSFFLFV